MGLACPHPQHILQCPWFRCGWTIAAWGEAGGIVGAVEEEFVAGGEAPQGSEALLLVLQQQKDLVWPEALGLSVPVVPLRAARSAGSLLMAVSPVSFTPSPRAHAAPPPAGAPHLWCNPGSGSLNFLFTPVEK